MGIAHCTTSVTPIAAAPLVVPMYKYISTWQWRRQALFTRLVRPRSRERRRWRVLLWLMGRPPPNAGGKGRYDFLIGRDLAYDMPSWTHFVNCRLVRSSSSPMGSQPCIGRPRITKGCCAVVAGIFSDSAGSI